MPVDFAFSRQNIFSHYRFLLGFSFEKPKNALGTRRFKRKVKNYAYALHAFWVHIEFD